MLAPAATNELTSTSNDLTGISTTTATSDSGPISQRVAVLLINFTTPTPSPSPTPSPTASPSSSTNPESTPSPTPSPTATPTPSPTPTPTPAAEPWTRAAVDGLYFTNQKSVASYFKEVSDGRMAMTGDVFGYFTLAVSTSSCDYGDWGADARLAAKSAGIDLSAYTNIVHAFAKQSSCWWGGPVRDEPRAGS
jgi:hypothetical protein